MNKEIFFCVNDVAYHNFSEVVSNLKGVIAIASDYIATEMAIKEKCNYIVTTSLAHLSFDLLPLGYDIFLCYGERGVKIEPHMDLSGIGEPGKDLRFGHNIFKMFRAGIFNELLGIEKGGKNE